MDRSDEILKLISQKKKVSVDDLCKYLHCSPATTRRELAKLDKQGIIQRVRGGAAYRIGTGYDYSAQYRMSVNMKEKQYICSLARDFISPGMSIFLDSSSTAEQLCIYLSQIPNLTVITNGISAAAILNHSDTVDTYIVGGHVESGSNTVLGGSAAAYIDNFNADIAILSCQGDPCSFSYIPPYIRAGGIQNSAARRNPVPLLIFKRPPRPSSACLKI